MNESIKCNKCGLPLWNDKSTTSNTICICPKDNKEITYFGVPISDFKVGDLVECDHYMEIPPLKGIVTEITDKGLIWVKLEIGGYKETFPPFIRKRS